VENWGSGGCQFGLNPAFTAHDNYNSKRIRRLDGGVSSKVLREYKHVGYNKAALAFIEAGGNDAKIPAVKRWRL